MHAYFTQIEGHRVRYWEGGDGFPILMLHGVGPGTSTVGNFGPVLEPLEEHCHVFAIDLIGFGDSERKKEGPLFDMDLWVRQGLAVLDRFIGGKRCGLVGHSLGGALALKIASHAPQVTKILTSSSIGASYPLNDALDAFWTLPRDPDELRRIMGNMVFDQSALSDEMLEERWEMLSQAGYGDYFTTMFGGDRQALIDAAVVSDEEAARITASITMMHGRNDKPCPVEQTTLVVAGKLPKADVLLLSDCGHNLPRERTHDYLAAARALFAPQ
ncbi:MAG: alpha/beta hydrolase [Proteobacteria bacterium]|nr:alpha/beta hydrolase [Pseudomonadota bacterium]MDA1323983.1 alpha/beta hydrolase [Pseudomonadota bacterium]